MYAPQPSPPETVIKNPLGPSSNVTEKSKSRNVNIQGSFNDATKATWVTPANSNSPFKKEHVSGSVLNNMPVTTNAPTCALNGRIQMTVVTATPYLLIEHLFASFGRRNDNPIFILFISTARLAKHKIMAPWRECTHSYLCLHLQVFCDDSSQQFT